MSEFLASLEGYPIQGGSMLNAAGINYKTLKDAAAMERLKSLESLARPNN